MKEPKAEYKPMDKFSVGGIALRIIDQMVANPMAFQTQHDELQLLFKLVEMEMYPPKLKEQK